MSRLARLTGLNARRTGVGALALISLCSFGCGDVESADEGVSAVQGALGAANNHTVLILSTTVVTDTSSGGTPPKSVEQEAAESLGYSVEVATPAVWAGKSAADFATYRAIILGEPNCALNPTALAPAEANRTVWGPVVNGNVVVLGNDTTFHVLNGPGLPADPRLVTRTGIQYAASGTKTGAFISLSCYYTTSPVNTAVPVLSPFANAGGAFAIQGNLACDNLMHNPQVGPPVFSVLTDAVLSNWNCSVHEGFNAFPGGFIPVAIDTQHTTGPGVLSFTDETSGLPFIVARTEVPSPVAACVQGSTSLDLRDRVVVNGNATTTAFTLGVDSRLNGDGNVAGNANLRNRARVTGTLRVQGTVHREPGVVIGTLINPTSVTVPPLASKTFPVGFGTRNINSSTTLFPGNYGTVNINGGTITLMPGTYNFAALTVNAAVTLNFSNTTATVMNVQGALTFNQVRYNAADPSRISWYSNGAVTVNSTQTPAFPGSILSPNGQVTIGPRNTINGCVQGRIVSVDADSVVNGH